MCATSGAGTVTLHGKLSSPTVSCGVLVAQSLVFGVVFCRSLFVFLFFFSFSHCIVCSSLIINFRLLLWYIQTFLKGLREKLGYQLYHGEKKLIKTYCFCSVSYYYY